MRTVEHELTFFVETVVGNSVVKETLHHLIEKIRNISVAILVQCPVLPLWLLG